MSSESIAAPQEAARPRPTAAVSVPWYLLVLGGILFLTAALNVVQLSRVGLSNTYYAAAVKSMLGSWHNFFFVSFDPGGFVTVDKPPVALWIQTASAKVFGFGGLSIVLPQAIAGVLSVALLYHLVARAWGRSGGLAAALALAVTPVMVVVGRSNLMESTLVLFLLLACWATLKAAETGRLLWLLLGAFLVGVGFNTKMLEAYLVVPALILVYLLGAPVRLRTRIGHLVLAGIVLLVVSLAWVTAVDLTPASQRPYVGSSGNNSELSLALGYNGIGRLTGNAMAFIRGGATVSGTISDLSPTNLGFTRGETGPAGVQRLVNAQLGGQAGWLLVLAVIGFVAGAWQRRVRLPLDRRQQSLVLWGGWLLTAGAFFSIAGFFHAYYLATIAPPVAALAGIGIVSLWQDYRRGGRRGWALPIALVLSALAEAHILGYFPSWSGWLTPLVTGGSIVVATALVALRVVRRLNSPVAPVALLAGVAALLLAPFIWSEYTVAHAAANMVPSAGPGGAGGFGGGRPRPGRGEEFGFGPGGPPPGGFGANGGPGEGFRFPRGGGFSGGGTFGRPGGAGRDEGAAANPNLVRYLEAHQGTVKFLVATPNAGVAEPFILTTGRPVMALGGFMSDRILTPAELATDISNGTVRYFLLSGRGDRFGPGNLPAAAREALQRRFGDRGFTGPFGGGPGGPGGNSDLTQWVTTHCRVVPPSAYGTVTIGGFGGGQQLYDCGSYGGA